MNTKLRTESKNDFEKVRKTEAKNDFKLINNAVVGKTMENVRKHRNIKLVTKDKRRNQLVSEPNYHTTKWFSEDFLAIKLKNTKVEMNKPVCLGLSIIQIRKILMCEFRYNYIKPKYQNNAKLCCMETYSFIIHIKIEDVYEDIANDVKKWFNTSNYSEIDNRPLPRGMNKKVIGLMKDELGGKIIKEFIALRPKTYSYLMDDNSNKKKDKGTKKCVMKRILKFNDYKECLFKNKIILKSKQRFKSESYNVYTEQINKIALSSNADKILQTLDKITTYPYRTNPFKACKSEKLSKYE